MFYEADGANKLCLAYVLALDVYHLSVVSLPIKQRIVNYIQNYHLRVVKHYF